MVAMGGFPIWDDQIILDHSLLRTNSLKNGFVDAIFSVGFLHDLNGSFMTRLPEVLPQSMYIFKQPLVGGEVTSHQEPAKMRGFVDVRGRMPIYDAVYVMQNYSKLVVPY